MVNRQRGNAERARVAKPVRDERDVPGDDAVARPPRAKLCESDRRVLTTFRTFLMVPGEMLCFASQDLASLSGAFRRLTDAGMLVAEKFPGAYSLTAAGFALMGAEK